ncbi:hypothetical protein GCM10009077_04080 [Roseibium denhamense]
MQKIRCETVDALEDIIVQQLKTGGADEIALAQRIERNEVEVADISIGSLPRNLQGAWKAYEDTVLAFAFRFFVQETNGANGELKFSFPFTDGTLGLTIGTENGLQRIGERKFTIAETVSELSNEVDCSDTSKKQGGNIFYPISGEIGMYEVLNTFFNISRSVTTVNAYTDRIEFTTTISGSVSPSIELSRADLTNASAKVSAGRVDTHQLLFTVDVDDGKSFQVINREQILRLPSPSRASTENRKARAIRTLEQEQFLINNDEVKNIILSNPQ